MFPSAEELSAISDVARAKGLVSAKIVTREGSFELVLGPLPTVAQHGPTLLPISRPIGEDGGKAQKLAAYRDAVECAHVNGWPDPAAFGLTPEDVGGL